MKNIILNLKGSPLDVRVSYFSNVKEVIPISCNLIDCLFEPTLKSKVESLRAIVDEERRAEFKKTMPSITPSGEFKVRKQSALQEHSRLISIDIDDKDNPALDMEEVKKLCTNLANALLVQKSVSGKGIWLLMEIEDPEQHKQHYDFVADVLEKEYSIKVDRSGSDVSRLRILSWDDEVYINPHAKKITSYKKINKIYKQLRVASNLDEEESLVQNLFTLIARCRIDITGKYSDWFSLGCFIANRYKDYGNKYFHLISQFHSGYNVNECDKQYNACLRFTGSYTLGTLRHHCNKNGIEISNGYVYYKGEYESYVN